MKKLLVILLMFMVFTLLGCTAKFNFNDQKPVTLFNEGLIAFRSGDRWGYLNESEDIYCLRSNDSHSRRTEVVTSINLPNTVIL